MTLVFALSGAATESRGVFTATTVVPPIAAEGFDVKHVFRVSPTIPADCSVDVAPQLRRLLLGVPSGSLIEFPGGGCYEIESTLLIAHRSHLVVDGNGARFRSLTPARDHRALWRIVDSRSIVLRNMTIRGSYEQGGHHDPDLQHAHAIDLRGSVAEISRVTMADVAGDCVYFGRGFGARRVPSSGRVHHATCVRTSRNGISITAGRDVVVDHLRTGAIGLTAVDLEPNDGPGWLARRVAIEDNTIGTYGLYAVALVGEPISDVEIAFNDMRGGNPTIAILGKTPPNRVYIHGNVVEEN